MLRHLTALVLLPAMALAGVTFETDQRPVNRAAPGSSYADMLARITPAVVSVRTAEVIPQSVLKRYSGRIDPDKVMQDEQTGEVLLPTGLGSGTIIHPDGYVITNRHVVLQENRRGVAKTVIVQLADRREFRAKVLGVDAGTDIAVLKIEGRNLPYAKFADSDKARVGDVDLRHRQSARRRAHRNLGHRLGLGSFRQTGHGHGLRGLHPDRRRDQSGQ